MDDIERLVINNRAWSHRMLQADPAFFSRLKLYLSPDEPQAAENSEE